MKNMETRTHERIPLLHFVMEYNPITDTKTLTCKLCGCIFASWDDYIELSSSYDEVLINEAFSRHIEYSPRCVIYRLK